MLILVAQVFATCMAAPLVVLLAWRAAHGRAVLASVGVILVLTGWVASAWVVSGDGNVGSLVNLVSHCAIALLLATYPDGRFVPRWTIAGVVAQFLLQFGNAASGWAWDDLFPWWTLAVGLITIALLLGGQLVRYLRRASALQRRQVAWPLLGLLTQIVAFTALTAIALALTGSIGGDLDVAASLLLYGLVALGFAVGLLWPDALPVDRALRAVIAVSVPALVLLGVFAALSGLLPAVGVREGAAAWLGAIAVGILAVPLARAGALLADLAVYRGRPDPLTVLERLGHRWEVDTDPRDVPPDLLAALGEALRLRGAELRGDGIGARWGTVEQDAEQFEIVHAGEALGALKVTPRAGEERLTEHDRLTIWHLVRQAAPALARARAQDELIEARVRLVHLRAEERRRLRRDLHDDLAPSFAGLGMSAAVVGELARVGDARAPDAAQRLAADLSRASRRIREIAYDLRPAVLDDRGLIAALVDGVATPEGGAGELVVRVQTRGELPLLPAATESAALRIITEGVTNVRRHAAASVCVVCVSATDDALVILIDDDGRGFPAGRTDGIGLPSMRERATELAGDVRFGRSDAGGARVQVRLPLSGVPS